MIDMAGDTSWLKPERVYEKVQILEESFKEVQDGTFDGRPPEKGDARGAANTTTAIVADCEKASTIPDGKKIKVSSTDEIPTGAYLVQYVHLNDGRLFLPAGEKLTGRNISLIKDMFELKRLKLGFQIVK